MSARLQAGGFPISERDERLVVQERSDGELLACFLAGRDDVAFAALVTRYGEMVLAVCQAVLRHWQDAEDACQASFLVLMRKASSLGEEHVLGKWLSCVAYHEATNIRKRKRRRQHNEERYERGQSSPSFAEAEFHELQTLLDAAVEGLPEKYRAPFALCCLGGASKAEAARILGWKVGTVSSRLAKGRKLVQRSLRGSGIIP